MIGVGVIGLGVGERHVHGFLQHPEAKLVAVCDTDPVKREMAKAKWPEARIYADAQELIASDDIGIVSIASYDDAHFDQALMAFRSNKHIFIEKPICLHQNELAELRRLHEVSPHLKISSNLILRQSPRFQQLRDMIMTGKLGTLYHVDADYNYGRLHKLTDGWRGDIPYYSVVHGGMVHMIDLVLWLSGEKIVEVEAMGNQIASRGSRFQHNDFVVAVARCQSGAIFKFGANFGCVTPHFHRLMVYGTQATFENRPEAGLLWTTRDPADAPVRLDTDYPAKDKGKLLPDFVESILNDRPPLTTTQEVFETMAVCLAIEKAVQHKGPVEVSMM